ncbi:Cof-type HAD-IIB family hydrolase [Neobacillus sp. WH10]|uniref:Cof-type HAD-IIB family hydrolase n=1 Tax=Neobacillus sp. WH10 TaxID=3047873 RepID=UPI0024C1B5A6|nr:Cof-type HAD-IIB family hydrolase [Neobacillus sp. WH10]WHY78581.1 Cof-type HAD-IIB family hydrolase [Neobacillus sp. WH10]
MSFIAIDLDGTLLNEQNEISEENIKAIQYAQDRGFEVVISTGRAYFDVQTICKRAGIVPLIIGTNGATIHSKDGKVLSSITISKVRVESILKWLDEQDYYYEVFTNKAIYTLKKRREHFYQEIQSLKETDLDTDRKEVVAAAERQFEQFGYVLVESYHDILKQEEEYFNILACSFDEKKLAEGWKQFNMIDELRVVSSADHNIEITNKRASKGNALEKLALMMNGSLEQSMAIGDSNNDLSMFEKVRHSVAMGNAKNDIKAVCTTTTLKNIDNGVAHAIYRYIENFVVHK